MADNKALDRHILPSREKSFPLCRDINLHRSQLVKFHQNESSSRLIVTCELTDDSDGVGDEGADDDVDE
jgi:hypothetical protein